VTDSTSARFVRDSHVIVRDLIRPRPIIYWADFLTTAVLAWAAFAVCVTDRFGWPVRVLAGVISGLAMYRAVVFTHEIAHQRASALKGFPVVWNLLCGIPLLMPTFLYGNHHGHHTSDAYGTWADPEYLLRTSRWRLRVLIFLLLPLLYPVLPAIRFLVLTPLASVSDRVNRFVWRHGSSLYVMNEFYVRAHDADAVAPSRWVLEAMGAIWAWTLVALVFAGVVPVMVFVAAYAVLVFWMSVNQVRTLVSHRYTSTVDTPVSYLEQVLDTNTFTRGRWLPHLWAPLGLRYHALHHLMPSMPYHAMGAAHRRLLRQLPADSPYRQTLRATFWEALSETVRGRDSGPRPAPRATIEEGQPTSR
jgi:fatty acid desaturase